ncbi:MAG: histidine kinase [Acidobacteriota bacterium]
MKPLKLRTKIILFTTLIVVGVVSGSFFLINQVVRDQVRSRLVHDLERSQKTLDQAQKNRLRELVAYSVIASENSTLKAAIETFQIEMRSGSATPVLDQLRRTVENEATKLFLILSADLLIITSNQGQILAIQGIEENSIPTDFNLLAQRSIVNSLLSQPLDFAEAASIWQVGAKVYRMVSVPILLQDIVVGTLSTGFEISPGLVATIKSNTDSDIVYSAGGNIVASTLGSVQNEALKSYLRQLPMSQLQVARTIQAEVKLAGETYLTLRVSAGDVAGGAFVVLNSIDQAMQATMGDIRQTLIWTGLISTVIAILLGLSLSESVTRPLMRFVGFMQGITRTGDLNQQFQSGAPNYEVDALARSFERMARSLNESQQQMANYDRELRQREIDEEKLRSLATRSRLDALISQINPHFLFNALNTVSVLIDENPTEARRLTLKLSNIFRQTLMASEREMISVQQELNFIQDYLEIEKARFGERLHIQQEVHVTEAGIPCFTLQPLVENAIKHGAAPKVGRTTICIQVNQTGNRLTIEVADDGVGMPERPIQEILSNGYGLKNLIDRLTILYASDFSWNFESQPRKGTRVRLDLPANPVRTA